MRLVIVSGPASPTQRYDGASTGIEVPTVNQLSTNHMPYCTDHHNELCRSATWTVGSIGLRLFGCESDVPPTRVNVRWPVPVQGLAYTVAEASRLAEALTALGMLAGSDQLDGEDREAAVAYWTARLDVLEEQDDRLAAS